MTMTDRRRVFLPLPADFFDHDDRNQRAICEQLALALIDQFGLQTGNGDDDAEMVGLDG